MFRSIRSRLVASYVLLTLITVIAVGVLALVLLRHSIAQQERRYLLANAEAVAQRASFFMPHRPYQLEQLAYTAAFFTDAQVRILDVTDHVLADSGQQDRAHPVLWFALPPGFDLAELALDRWPGRGLSDGDLPLEVDGRGILFMAPLRDSNLPRWFLEGGMQVRRGDGLDESPLHLFFEGPLTEEIESVEEYPTDKQPMYRVRVPIGEEESPLGYVELSGNPQYGNDTLATTRRALGWAAVGAALLAALMGIVVSRHLTAPLQQLTLAAGCMSEGDLSARAREERADEIGQLATQFNRMASRLESSFAELAAERDTLRRFIADASHELRTPITALKTFNELLQGPAAQDPAAQSEFLLESEVQLDRLAWITQNLLDLSRLEAGLVELQWAHHNIGEVMETVAAPFRVSAQEKNLSLTIEAPPGQLVYGDRRRLELALSNIVDNALTYTPSGGAVTLGASVIGGETELWIRDTGLGIDPADQPHLFERFYRGRTAREPGSGLGLAITQSIIQAHGGRIQVESTPGGGACFRLYLPHSLTINLLPAMVE
ncbi:MAG: HAMP domain-containing histidine kinase [Chloroflexota bacterium]|nr:HAMP domain-containing histidine kinase [Chloroflexota bacterium]